MDPSSAETLTICNGSGVSASLATAVALHHDYKGNGNESPPSVPIIKVEAWNHAGLEDVAPPANAYRKRNCLMLSLALLALAVVSMGIHVTVVAHMSESLDKRQGNGSISSETLKWREDTEACMKLRAAEEKRKDDTEPESTLFDEFGRFILEDYDAKPTFSNFLPGVAGLYGKPLWSFYVNRGQAVASFGVKSKNYPIMEFNPANKAYQNTPYVGFRTFLEGTRLDSNGAAKSTFLYEPFAPARTNHYATAMRKLRKQHQDVPQDQTESGNKKDEDPMLTSFAAQHCLEEQKLPKRVMYVGGNEVQIQEVDYIHGLEVNVSYFILPEESYGAFVRRTTIRNLDTKSSVSLSVLDGLARMEPFIGSTYEDELLKHLGRTLEGWFDVYHADDENRTMPFYKVQSVPSDKAAIEVIRAGHYCLSFLQLSDRQQKLKHDFYYDSLLPIVYDTDQIFGEDSTLQRPAGLLMQHAQRSIRNLLQKGNPQYGAAKTTSAMAGIDEIILEPDESVTINTLYGWAAYITDVPVIARKAMQRGYIQYKYTRAREIVNQLTAAVDTVTANSLFDGHINQMFMDNGLRGGIPLIFGDIDDRSSMRTSDEDPRLKVFHVFSRYHGDLERDYNNFEIDPTYFSQGPGNFRDVLQNRRNDVIFNPRVGSFNIQTFFSYIQADGYNPLSVEAAVYVIRDEQQCDRLATMAVGSAVGHRAQRDSLDHMLCNGPFRPGQLFLLMEEQNIELIMDRQRFIDEVLSVSHSYPMAVFSDGYWADHWTYYLDLVDSYLAIFPEKEYELLFGSKLNYFYSATTVKPRSDKYVLSYTMDGWGRHVQQLNATISPDMDKFSIQMTFLQASTNWFGINANWQHDSSGFIFVSTPFEKIFLLATLKFATRDAYGMGIEYEAGKPGWNDAMNGLAGMLGSGMPETYELRRLLTYLRNATKCHLLKRSQSISVPQELGTLLDEIQAGLDELKNALNFTQTFQSDQEYIDESRAPQAVPRDVPDARFQYWDKISSAREQYREATRLNFNGLTKVLSAQNILSMLDQWIDQVNEGIERALAIGTNGLGNNGTSGVPPTYFYYEVTRWSILTSKQAANGLPLVRATAMRVGTLPLFLEGPVRMMSTISSEETLDLYHKIKSSGLRDNKLGMYTVSASLVGQSFDMGRAKAFPTGWLENQSIWLHMSYKYYLGLLRNKLYQQFFDEMLNGGMLPFMKANTYGRSLLECSSFIASSAFEDANQHGRGFLARFSGATSEFLSMWILMFIGPTPFYLDKESGELTMQLVPSLPMWLFEKPVSSDKTTRSTPNEKTKNTRSLQEDDKVPTVMFKLFGTIHVTYHNIERKDLFDQHPIRYIVFYKDGSKLTIENKVIVGDIAAKIRGQLLVDAIHAFF